MCFWFDSCFGCFGNRPEDYGRPGTPRHAADEAGRKAYNDPRKDHVVVAGAAATRDGHGYTAYAQDMAYTYSAADETLKLPARNNKVGDHTGYKARFADHMEDTTDYHYPASTTTVASPYNY